jgi:hypothetical protein
LSYTNHFLAAHQFFSERWGFGLSVPGDADGMPFSLGWAHLIVAIAVSVLLWRNETRQWRQWIAFLAIAIVVLCFLMTAGSQPLWDVFPIAHYVVFPWRLLAIAVLALAMAVGAFAIVSPRDRWVAAVVALLVLANVRHARPERYLSIDPLLWTPQQIASRGVRAATFDTFESGWVLTRPASLEDSRLRIEHRTPTRLQAVAVTATAADLDLPVAYFPGWRVWIDGTRAPIHDPSTDGRVRVHVGAGRHAIVATFETTRIRRLANVISVFSLLLLLLSGKLPLLKR